MSLSVEDLLQRYAAGERDFGGVVVAGAPRGRNFRREADLCGANLRGAQLLGAQLRGADLRGADLRGALLRGVDIAHANLSDAKLDDAQLVTTDATAACFARACARYSSFRNSALNGANFKAASLEATRWMGVRAKRVCFDRAQLDESVLRYTSWTDSSLRNASLRNITLCMGHLVQVDARDADFRGAVLGGLSGKFGGANFSDAHFRADANLEASEGDFSRCQFHRCVAGGTLSAAKNVFDEATFVAARLHLTPTTRAQDSFRGARFWATQVDPDGVLPKSDGESVWSPSPLLRDHTNRAPSTNPRVRIKRQHRSELETWLRDHPDDEDSWAVYASLLENSGDQRGELIALEQRAAQVEDTRALSREASRLFEQQHNRWLGPLREHVMAGSWYRGFLIEASIAERFAEAVSLLAERRIGALLRLLYLVGLAPPDALELRESLARLGVPQVHVLRPEPGTSLALLADHEGLHSLTCQEMQLQGLQHPARLPALEHLSLQDCSGSLGALSQGFSELRTLELHCHYGRPFGVLTELEAVAALPALERLTLKGVCPETELPLRALSRHPTLRELHLELHGGFSMVEDELLDLARQVQLHVYGVVEPGAGEQLATQLRQLGAHVR